MLPTFKKLDEIPEPFRAAYEERDGMFHPKAPDTAKLEESLAAVRAEKKDAEKRAKENADKLADLQRQLTAASSGEEKDKVTKALAKFDADAAELKKEYDAKLATAHGELRTLKLDDKIKAAALAAGVIPSKVDAVLKLTKETFDLGDDGRIIVKDDKGAATTTTVEDYFAKTYKPLMPELYAGTKASGGGAGGGSHSTRSTGSGQMTAEQIMANPLKALQASNEAAAA